jgi:hypothetical protein
VDVEERSDLGDGELVPSSSKAVRILNAGVTLWTEV